MINRIKKALDKIYRWFLWSPNPVDPDGDQDSPVTFRGMLPQDVSALVWMEQQCFPEVYATPQELIANMGGVMLAVSNGVIVGYTIAALDEDMSQFRIYRIGVRPTVRRQGIGTELVRMAFAGANTVYTCTEVVALCRETNTRAIQFFTELGFSTALVGQPFEEFDEDGIWMSRPVPLRSVVKS